MAIAAAAPLIAALLPQVVLGIQQGIEMYNTLVNHPATPDDLKAQYADLSAKLDVTRAEVNATIARTLGQLEA